MNFKIIIISIFAFCIPLNAECAKPVSHTLHIDLNGDGSKETVTWSQDPKAITLSVLDKKNASVEQHLIFGMDPARQDAVCKLPVKLVVIDQQCDPLDEPLPGCKSESKGKALLINDDICDPIILYWNHDDDLLNWWRL